MYKTEWGALQTYDTMMLFRLTLTHIFPKFGPQLHKCNSVRVHPYAPPQHTMKVLKHFIYIKYGDEIQSEVVYSVQA